MLMTLYQISVFNLQIQRLHYLIYDDSVSEADICQQVDPRADWPVESSNGLFNIASVCLRVDPNQRPDMEEVSNTHKIIKNYSSFHIRRSSCSWNNFNRALKSLHIMFIVLFLL